MAVAVGDRFVRRHAAARSSTSWTATADLPVDTAVIEDGTGYGTWTSDEISVDTAGKYLCIAGLGRTGGTTTRGSGFTGIVVNGTLEGLPGLAGNYYERNTGTAQDSNGLGAAILDLSASDTVGMSIDAATASEINGAFTVAANDGGGFQLLRLPDGDFCHLERSTALNISNSNIDSTRPWTDSSGTWTKVTWPTETADDGNWHAASSGDVVLPANSKFLVVWTLLCNTAENTRAALVARLNINSTNRQYGSGYMRGSANQDTVAMGVYLHETGGSTETLYVEATQECNDATIGQATVKGALQIIKLNSGAEWIHVDNGTTDTGTSDLASNSTWYGLTLSSTFRAHGASDLSLDDTNDAVQNDSGASMPILAIAWENWDRDANTNTSRKIPTARFNDGSAINYGWHGGYNRGNGTDNVWHSAFCIAALHDLANAADLTVEHQDRSTNSNADMGIYCSSASNRHMLGFQVLDLGTLAASPQNVAIVAASETDTAAALTVTLGPLTQAITAATETSTAAALTVTLGPTTVALVAATETDTAGTLTPTLGPVTVALTAATETDTAATLTPTLGPVTEPIAAASETSTAGTLTPSLVFTLALASATETSTAATLTPSLGPLTQALVAATEAGTAAALTASLGPTTVAIVAATETDTAAALTETLGPLTQAITAATETSTAATLTVDTGSSQDVAIVAATETDTAATFTVTLGSLSQPITAASETNTAGTLAPSLALTQPITAVTEASTAGTLTASLGPLSQSITAASETDTAAALTPTLELTQPITAATETSTPGTLTVAVGPVTVALTAATETSTAGTLTPTLGPVTVALTAATETDTAATLTPTLAYSAELTAATETSTAAALTPTVGPLTQPLTAATETNTAAALTVGFGALTQAIAAATETNTAGTFTASLGLAHPITAATETDTANPLTVTLGPLTVPITGATETSTAAAFQLPPGPLYATVTTARRHATVTNPERHALVTASRRHATVEDI